ncbi:hypothetical protein TIFTF001_012180 [Ficus carica]|uniref:Uncharacterized protein n=1 Tax=Ficus carica TaxID=3494 RepID=A0AA88AMY2_FICCA|nr:hypothetical protein TIFTF001_012180 [Ficus carica]
MVTAGDSGDYRRSLTTRRIMDEKHESDTWRAGRGAWSLDEAWSPRKLVRPPRSAKTRGTRPGVGE